MPWSGVEPEQGRSQRGPRCDKATIRTVQDLLGYAKLETMQIYLHCLSKPGLGVPSPLDG